MGDILFDLLTYLSSKDIKDLSESSLSLNYNIDIIYQKPIYWKRRMELDYPEHLDSGVNNRLLWDFLNYAKYSSEKKYIVGLPIVGFIIKYMPFYNDNELIELIDYISWQYDSGRIMSIDNPNLPFLSPNERKLIHEYKKKDLSLLVNRDKLFIALMKNFGEWLWPMINEPPLIQPPNYTKLFKFLDKAYISEKYDLILFIIDHYRKGLSQNRYTNALSHTYQIAEKDKNTKFIKLLTDRYGENI